MRISGAFASETGAAKTAKSVEGASADGSRRGRLRAGYILAVAWVIIGLGLYGFQMVKLAAGLG
jgi:hypothetical protein